MRRLEFTGFMRLKATVPLFLSFFLTAAGMYPPATFLNLSTLPFFNSAYAAESTSGSLDGTWLLSLPMPGGTEESTLMLVTHGNSISGTMSSPGVPTDVHAIYGGALQNGSFRLSADIDRITYFLQGTHSKNTLSFDLKTTETIRLDPGHRLSGTSGELSGLYLVPVYSPGGIKENYFDIHAENGIITGQMYVPVTAVEAAEEKRDVNTFYSGTYTGNRISLYTRTAQGSLFYFTGTIVGNLIDLTMHVTDQRKDLEAIRAE